MTGTAIRDHLAPMLPVLIDAAIKAAALLVLAGVATALMRKASAAGRQLVWFLAMLGLLVLPVLSVALPAWQVLPGWARLDAPAAKPAPAAVAVASPTPAPTGDDRHEREALAGTGETAPVSAMPDEPAAARPALAAKPAAPLAPAPIGAAAAPWSALLPWAPAAWLAGAIACLLPLLLGRLSLWRLRRAARPMDDPAWQGCLATAAAVLGLRRPVRLLASDQRTMPMIWGILRPVLLLPADAAKWSPQRLQVVLMHELAHAKRSDCLMRLLAHLACSAYWFNPLAWLAFRRLQSEAEVACDDLVLASGHKASDYAECLLDIASGLSSGMLATYSSIAMARPSKLEGRLLAILDERRNRRKLTGGLILLAAIVLAGLVVPLSLLKAAGEGEVKQPTFGPEREVILDIASHDKIALNFDAGFQPVFPEDRGKDEAALTRWVKENNESLLVAAKSTDGSNRAGVVGWGMSNARIDDKDWLDLKPQRVVEAFRGIYPADAAEPVFKVLLKPGEMYTGLFKTRLGTIGVFQMTRIDQPNGLKIRYRILQKPGLVMPPTTMPAASEPATQPVGRASPASVPAGSARPTSQPATRPARPGPYQPVSFRADRVTFQRIADPSDPKYEIYVPIVKGNVIVSQGNPDSASFLSIKADEGVLYPLNLSATQPASMAASQPHSLAKPGGIVGVYLTGNVIFRRGEQTLTPREIYYDFENGRATLLQAEIGLGQADKPIPLHIRAEEARQLAARTGGTDEPAGRALPAGGDNDSEAVAGSARPTSQPASAFTVKLSNGVTVELVGVSENPSQGKPWWRPDGERLSKSPYQHLNYTTTSPGGRERAWEFAVLLSNLPNEDVATTSAFDPSGMSSTSGMMIESDDRTAILPGLRAVVASLPVSADHVMMKFGVATGPWRTLAKDTMFEGSSGSYTASENRPAGLDVSFSPATVSVKGVVLTVAHNVSEQDIRVVAVDRTGKVVTATNSSGGSGGKVSQTTVTFSGLTLANITKFELQARPYEWAEFRDVSLRPGQPVGRAMPADGEGHAAVAGSARPTSQPATQQAASTLEFRIAPYRPKTVQGPSVDADEWEWYQELLSQGKIGRWWKPGERIAGRMPEYLWLPVQADADRLNPELVVGKYQGRTYLLLSDKPGQRMIAESGDSNVWGLKSVKVTKDSLAQPALRVEFDENGSAQMAALSKANVKASLAIIVDSQVVSAPIIMTELSDSIRIEGSLTTEQVDRMVRAYQAGMPPDTQPATRPAAAARAEDSTGGDADRRIRMRLGDAVNHIGFNGTRFEDVVEVMHGLAGADITVNWQALEKAGVTKDTPVKLTRKDVTGGQMLRTVLDSIGSKLPLDYVITNGTITITTRDDLLKRMVTQAYDIGDLIVEIPDSSPPLLWSVATGSAAAQKTAESATAQLDRAKDVVKAVREGLDADSWTIPGTETSTLNGSLTVTQTPANQEKIARLLQAMRQARGGKVSIETRFFNPGKQMDGEIAALMHKSARRVLDAGGAQGILLGEAEAQAIIAKVADTRDGRMLTSPRLTVFHNQKAFVSVTRQPVVSLPLVAGGGGQVSMAFLSGAWVAAQPVIAPDGRHITLTLDAVCTGLDPDGAGQMSIISQVKGTVLLADGEWLLACMPGQKSKVTGAKEMVGPDGAKDYQVVQGEAKPTGEFVYFLLKPTILAQAK